MSDALGNSIGTAGVVTDFRLVQMVQGTVVQDVTETVQSTNSSTAFRYDPSEQQWIFVINTKPLAPNATYVYRISLNDGTTIQFSFGLK